MVANVNEHSEPKLREQAKNFLVAHGLKLIVATFAIVCVIGMGWLLVSSTDPSPRETTLGAILLAVFSIVASYLITKVYAEVTYSQTLRDHGVQIARNIILLQNQVQKLKGWVIEKRGSAQNSPTDATLEHIEETLQGFEGMTDVALNGITQMIGDAWAQYQTIMDKMAKLRREESQEINSLQQEFTQSGMTEEKLVLLQERVAAVADKTENRLAALANRSPLPIFPPAKRMFSADCPYCAGSNKFDISDRPGETRKVVCDTCSGRFNVHLRKDQRILVRPDPLFLASQVSPDSFEQRVRRFLQEKGAWIEPKQLPEMIRLVRAADGELTRAGNERSPHNLINTILGMEDELTRIGISKTSVRRFIRLLYLGRAFDFGPDRVAGMRTPYIADLNEPGLVAAFTQANLYRIRKDLGIPAGGLVQIARVMIPPGWLNAEDIVGEAFSLLPQEKNTVDSA